MVDYRFTKNELDKLLNSMMELSNANPEMSLEEVAYEVCKDAYHNVDESNHALESLLYILENDSIFEIEYGILEHCFISDIKEVEIPLNVTIIAYSAFL